VAFTVADWTARVTAPIATTFVAVELGTRDILSSVTLLDSLSIPDDWNIPEKNADSLSAPIHWQAAAVYTLPQARRKGAASEVLYAAVDWARQVAHSQDRNFLVTAIVLDTNSTARAWYERCGFSISSRRDDEVLMALYIPSGK
jgi:GNAT superfamily N-acetyltransferase